MFFLFALSSSTENKTHFQKIKIPTAPVFSWYKFIGGLKGLFDGKTIWRLTFNSTEPDLPYYASRMVGKFLPDDVNLQNKVNEFIDKVNGNSNAQILSTSDKDTYKESKFVASNAYLLDDDLAHEMSFTEYGLTQEEGEALMHSIFAFSLVIVPIIISFVVNFLYFFFYCFLCCCPCCHRKRSDNPGVVAIVFFLIGIVLILLGYVFTMVSYIGFDNIVVTTRSLPHLIDESVDSFATSMSSVSSSLSNLISTQFDDVTQKLNGIINFTKSVINGVANNLTETVYYMIHDDKILEKNGAVFYFTRGFSRGNSEMNFTVSNYNSNYTQDFLNWIENTGYSLGMLTDSFAQFEKSFKSIEENAESLKDLTNTIDNFRTIILDYFPDLEEKINDFSDKFKNISNMKLSGNKSVSETIDEIRTSDSIISLKDLANETVEEYIDPNWTYIKLAYFALLSLNLILVITFVGSFWCHTCCSACIASCAECYPCACTIILFIFGLFTTVISAVFVFFGRNFTPTLDSGVNSSIYTVIPGGILTFPPMDFSKKTDGNVVTKLQLPPLNLTDLKLFEKAFNSDLGTGITKFLSLDKIIPMDKFGKALGDFIPAAISEFNIKGRIDKYTKEAVDFWETDAIPETFEGLEAKYINQTINDGGEEKQITNVYGIYELYYSQCERLRDVYAKLEDRTKSGCLSHAGDPNYCSAVCGYCFDVNHDLTCTCPIKVNPSIVPETFLLLCQNSANETMENISRRMKDKYETGIGYKNNAMQQVNNLGKDVNNQVELVSGSAVGLVTKLAESFLTTLNEIKADPIINGVAIFYNTVFYDISYWATLFSMGSTLIIWGFFISVLLLCIRRRGMKPKEQKPADSYTDYSDTQSSYSYSDVAKKNAANNNNNNNNKSTKPQQKTENLTIDFSKRKTKPEVRRVSSSDSSGSSSYSSSGVKNNRRHNMNDSRFFI